MRALSAIDAMEPAWERMRELLFKDFKLSRFMKLASVATLAALGAGVSFNLNLPSHNQMHGAPAAAKATMIAMASVMALIIAIVFVIGLAVLYFGSRMQFVLFEMIVTRQTTIKPMWQHYAQRTWRWIGLKVTMFVAFVGAIALFFLPLLIATHGFRNGMHGLGATIFAMFIPIFFAIMIFFAAIYLTWDFVLPVVAIEDARILAGIRTAWENLRGSFGAVLGFLGMRIVIGIICGIAAAISIVFSILAAAIPLGIVAAIVYFALRHAGIVGHILMVLVFVLEGCVAFAWMVLVYIAVLGVVTTFTQSYAAYFYGGRYPKLGELLEPPAIEPVSVAPVVPPLPEPGVV